MTDMLLDVNTLAFRKAEKNKPIRAKALASVVPDKSVHKSLLVRTLEGDEPLREGSLLCLGEVGEPWLQMPAKLMKKYKISDVDADGWMVCTPIPGVQENAAEVLGDFYVQGQWGEKMMVAGREVYVQKGKSGDFVLRSPSDLSDVWVVRRSLFLATYSFVS
jgi:hypothetical protein